MRIFVTGGAGFVGSNLVERLIADGHVVTAYDNLSMGSRFFLQSCEAQPGFRFIEADLSTSPRCVSPSPVTMRYFTWPQTRISPPAVCKVIWTCVLERLQPTTFSKP